MKKCGSRTEINRSEAYMCKITFFRLFLCEVCLLPITIFHSRILRIHHRLKRDTWSFYCFCAHFFYHYLNILFCQRRVAELNWTIFSYFFSSNRKRRSDGSTIGVLRVVPTQSSLYDSIRESTCISFKNLYHYKDKPSGRVHSSSCSGDGKIWGLEFGEDKIVTKTWFYRLYLPVIPIFAAKDRGFSSSWTGKMYFDYFYEMIFSSLPDEVKEEENFCEWIKINMQCYTLYQCL